jgi:pyruvate,water dikinase
VNVTPDEVARYAPRKMDVINLETDTFETVEVRDLLAECGGAIPAIDKIVSVFDGQSLRRPLGHSLDFKKDDLVVTFDGLVGHTSFVPQLREVMRVLEQTLQTPVDIEFASDGSHCFSGPTATSPTAPSRTSPTLSMSTLSSTRTCPIQRSSWRWAGR